MTTPTDPTSPFLPHLPVELLESRYRAGAGRELESGKLSSAESSSALVANTFGFFCGEAWKAAQLPPLPGLPEAGWPAHEVVLEREVRFPWSGGRHPWLDVVIETGTHVIGIESKRYEPFRSHSRSRLSEAYWRDVWGERMGRWQAVRDAVHTGDAVLATLEALDVTQLLKHALGLVAQRARAGGRHQAVLVYLHADPSHWPDGRPVDADARHRHQAAIDLFTREVRGDEVAFQALTYAQLLAGWEASGDAALRSHVAAVRARFDLS